MTDRTIQEALADACLDGTAADELARDPAEFLRKRGVAEEDVAALGEGARRFALYRELVRNNLKGVTYNLLSLTRERVGERFDRDFSAFLAESGPESPYLRDVPFEFVEWVLPRWAADPAVPRWATDSARHELALFAAGAAPPLPEPPTLVDLAVDRPVAMSGSVRLIGLEHAVHLPFEGAPEVRPVLLLVHRDAEWVVRVLELTDLAHALVERLLDRAPLQAAIADACTKTGQPMDDAALASIARLLADFGERGIILGASP